MRGRLLTAAGLLLAGSGVVVPLQLWGPAPVPSGPRRTASAGMGEVTRVSLPAAGLTAVPVCPGPQSLVVPDGGRALDPSGPVVVGAVVEPVASGPPASLDGTVLRDGGDGFTLAALPRTSAGLVTVKIPPSSVAPAMSAVQLALARSGDARGLTALACPGTATRSWLVGGGTRTGRRGRLVLANPAAGPAEASIVVHGPGGAVGASGGTTVAIPPHGVRAVRIDALAPGLDSVAVLVLARRGRVSATLQDSDVRGLTPAGADDIGPSAPPARRQIVPGLTVTAPSGAVPKGPAVPRATSAEAAVRVVNPGAEEAVVKITLLGASGPVTMPGAVLTLPPGAVSDVPVSGVAAGSYAAVVEADTEVVAGAVVTERADGGGRSPDVGWAASVQALGGPAVLALPSPTENGRPVPVTTVLSVVAPDGAGSLEIVQLEATGKRLSTTTLPVPARSSVICALAPTAAAVRLRPVEGSAALMAAAVLHVADTAGPMVSVVPVRPGHAATSERPHVVSDVRTGLS
ncbi:MAG: hypothetical protein QG622_2649 [Actinomycetota bacterium]|nr:hypothetical protein [Actinomycetota bacterium]